MDFDSCPLYKVCSKLLQCPLLFFLTDICSLITCSAVPNARSYTIRIGSTLKRKGGTLHKVKRIVQHKQYNGRIVDFDYSLLELVDSIQFNEASQPISLPEEQDRVEDNQTCLVTGWGETKSYERNDKLRGAEVPIVNQEKCSKAYRRYGGVTARMLCAGFDKGGIDACQVKKKRDSS